jgi:hypothetical protein
VLPELDGAPIRVEVRASLGRHWAATSIPSRLILLDRGVLAEVGEFERILLHELFHFVWVRLSNAQRRAWEAILNAEFERGVEGELGWSAELRKQRLTQTQLRHRQAVWRAYARESFCDSAACIYSGVGKHDEFTLPSPQVRLRKAYFKNLATNGLRL